MNRFLLLSTLLIFASCASDTKQNPAEPVVEQVSSEQERKLILHPKGTDSGELEGFQSINFGFDKSHLTETAKAKLRANIKWLEENPGLNLKIEGHCDPTGNAKYNLQLGKKRANAVLAYLIKIGVNPARLSTISYGENTLLNPSSNKDNRRVNLLPIPR